MKTMASQTSLLILSCFLSITHFSAALHPDKTLPMPDFNSTITETIRKTPLNIIDSCRRTKANWAWNRQALANCAIGFGKHAMGGKYGPIYVVTNSSDDPVNPPPGTLRYGVIQDEPLWIIFAHDMVISLSTELTMTSYKTIDGRGAKVEIAYGPCITIQGVSHVIVHGISIHDCKPGEAGMVRSSIKSVGHHDRSDGDAISILTSSHVWIDHCYLAQCTDGLIDITHASTSITVSNNYFTQHDKVMLLGHSNHYSADEVMKVTIAFNYFGPGLVERMPRVRFGYAHVANNRYQEWEMYAIGGSASPTIFSEGNFFFAPSNRYSKQVTKRQGLAYGWKSWKWRSSKDIFLNGAYFVQSGYGSYTPTYGRDESFPVAPGVLVPALTAHAGPLRCVVARPC